MLFRLLPFLRFLSVPENGASPRQWLVWRGSVAGVALLSLFVGLVGLGWVPYLPGYAYAEDIDVKITKALAPVTARLIVIERSQETQGVYLTRLVKSDIAQDIHADKRLWCRADTSQEKQRLRERLDLLQQEYEELAGVGQRVTEPDCE